MIDMPKQSAAFVFALLAMTLSTVKAQDQISFDRPDTELTGRLLGSFVMLGSGEMLEGSILYLEEPISIAGNENSDDRRNRKSVKNVDKVLLNFEGEEPTDDMLGGNVLITGRLVNEPSDPFHTEVLMLVTDAVLIEASGDGKPVATFKTH